MKSLALLAARTLAVVLTVSCIPDLAVGQPSPASSAPGKIAISKVSAGDKEVKANNAVVDSSYALLYYANGAGVPIEIASTTALSDGTLDFKGLTQNLKSGDLLRILDASAIAKWEMNHTTDESSQSEIKVTAAPPPSDSLEIGVNGGGLNQPVTVSFNSAVAIAIQAISANGKPDPAFTGTVSLSASDPSTNATIVPATLALAAGRGTATVTFKETGSQVISAKLNDSATPFTSAPVNVDSTVGGCSSCFAMIGAGAVVSNLFSDYNDTNNVLEATHIGQSTPQYSFGLAYKLPIPGIGFLKSSFNCSTGKKSSRPEAQEAYCFPYKVFVSFKFTPDASQTFNGFMYGLSHALHPDIDMLAGLSYSAYNQVSPGFYNAALNVVQTQQAKNNPCYAMWNLSQLTEQGEESQNVFDGFPTLLMTNTAPTGANPVCTPGAQIYPGSPLSIHYHPGFFVGIAVPISFKKFLE